MAKKMCDKRGNPLDIDTWLWREGNLATLRQVERINYQGDATLFLRKPEGSTNFDLGYPIAMSQHELTKSDWVVPIVAGKGVVEGTSFLVHGHRWQVVNKYQIETPGDPLGHWSTQRCGGKGDFFMRKGSDILAFITAEMREKAAVLASWPERPPGWVPAPVRWKWKENGEPNDYILMDADTSDWVISFRMNGALMDVRQKEIMRMIAAMPETLEALRGLLEQVTGPVMVHGDGRGIDGTKVGLSGDEFNALRDKRIAAARDAIANAAPVVGN